MDEHDAERRDFLGKATLRPVVVAYERLRILAETRGSWRLP